MKKTKKIIAVVIAVAGVLVLPIIQVGTGVSVCAGGTRSATLTRQAKAADGEIDEISAEEQTNTDPVNETENTESNQNAGMDESIEVFLNGLYQEVNELPPPVEFDPTTQEIPEDVQLNVEEIHQLPELPTGCEITSLTMLLRYYGFADAEKQMMVDQYLVYANEFVTGFFGDPRSESGAGIYPPGLMKTADNFLQAHGSTLYAKDITGSTREILYAYLAHGDPIVIWNTMYFNDNLPSGIVEAYEGREYEWDYNEHCIVLSGYNQAEGTVTVNDPLEGIVERDADRLFELYENLGSMAIVLQ